MASFEQWYEQHRQAINQCETRKDIAFYIWTNKPKTSAKTSAKSEGGYTQEFEMFWNKYPNKTAKFTAYQAWQKQKPDLEKCLKMVEYKKSTQQWKNENGKYVPHGATFLNRREFEDVIPEEPVQELITFTDMDGIKRTKVREK